MWSYRILSLGVALLVLAGCATTSQQGDMSRHVFADMMYLEDATSARASSWDRTGGNGDCRSIPVGETLELANIEGAGCIRHIYFTTIGAPSHFRRDSVLRMYWDGEETPSVEVPFGDFFGLGHDRPRFYRSLLVTVNEGSSGPTGSIGYNSYFPMPFSNGARITITNDGPVPVNALWFHIDYEKRESMDPRVGRFHAQWRRENLTTPVGDQPNVSLHGGRNTDGKENYVILDAKGHGNLAGYFLNVDNVAGGWYGEGDDAIFIDGEGWPPSFHGTGTEEIFGGGACPNVPYAGPYTGFHIIGNENFDGKTSMYRFFVTDPVRFKKSIEVSIEHGHANNYGTDYSSTAFWYQSEPHAAFPELLPVMERRPLEGDDPFDQAHIKETEVQDLFRKAITLYYAKQVGLPPETGATVTGNLHKASALMADRKYEEAIVLFDEAASVLKAHLKEHGVE